jgi:hypothetical protein
MGYYTRYELDFDYTKKNSKDILQKESEIKEIVGSNLTEDTKHKLLKELHLKYLNGLPTKETVIKFFKFNPFDGECKWYDHEDDMRRLSNVYNDIIFILNGFGEDSEDIWRKYFYNGKCQVAEAKITYDKCQFLD